MNSMGPCYSLLNMKVIRLNIVSAPPPIKMGREGGDLWQDKTLWVELKTNGGGYYLLPYYYTFIISILSNQPRPRKVKCFF